MNNLTGAKVKITTAAGDVYRIAGNSFADENQWHGRLKNDIALSFVMNTAGAVPASLSLILDNRDLIPTTSELWGSVVEITAENSRKWLGKVTAYEYGADKELTLSVQEKAAPEFERYIPDEVMRLATVDENLHASFVNSTLPTVVGGSTESPILIPGILVDKTAGIYLLCVGEIHQIVNVYRGYDKLTTGFAAYTGTALQSDYPGIAYIKLIDADLQKNDDGSYTEISAEVVGLKLGSHSQEECRNGARFLYYLLTTPATGACGWGLGIPAEDIDVNSFNVAASLLQAASIKTDAVLFYRQQAQIWINNLCQAIRGTYAIGADSKRRLIIDAPKLTAVADFADEIKITSYGKRSYSGRVYNKGVLHYAYNSITGKFMQSAYFVDTDSVSIIGEQEFVGESYFIQDSATAQAILEYTCKRSLAGAETIEFSRVNLEPSLKNGDVITISRSDFDISGMFQITALEVKTFESKVVAMRFSNDFFNVEGESSTIAWSDDVPVNPAYVPGQPLNFSLSTFVREQNIKTNIIVLTGSFDYPDGYQFNASVEYAENEPNNWKSHGIISGNSFEISSVKPSTLYYVRIKLVNTNSHSTYAIASLRTQGNSLAPAAPTLLVDVYLQIAKIQIFLNNPPDDLVGFKIYKSIAGETGFEYIGHALAVDGLATYVDKIENYHQEIVYVAKSYDIWGNESDLSEVSDNIKAMRIADSDLLKMLTPADALNTDPYFIDSSAWIRLDGENLSQSCFSTIEDGIVGKSAFVSNASETYQVAVPAEKLVVYEPGKKYVLEGYFRCSEGAHKMGFAIYDAAKSLLASNFSDIEATGTFSKKIKLLSDIPANAAYLSPVFYVNSTESANAILEVQKLQLREIITADRLIANEAIITTAAQIAAAVIGNAHIQNLDAGKINSGAMKSINYIAPDSGEKYAKSGSLYDLNNATIKTEHFYSDNSGAGFKGEVQAETGRVGVFYINDRFLSNFPILKIESARVGREQEFLYYFSIIYSDILDGFGRPVDYFYSDVHDGEGYFEEYAEKELLCFGQMAEILGNDIELLPLSDDIASGCKIVVHNTLAAQSDAHDIIAKIIAGSSTIFCKVSANDYLNLESVFWSVTVLQGDFDNLIDISPAYITGPFIASESCQIGSTPYLSIETRDFSSFVSNPNSVYPGLIFQNWNGLDITPPPWSVASAMFSVESNSITMGGGNLRAIFDENTGNISLSVLGELKTDSSVLYPNNGTMFLDSGYVGTIWVLLGSVDLDKSDRYSIYTRMLIGTMRIDFNISGNLGTPGELSFLNVSSDNWEPGWSHLTYAAWLMSARGEVYLRLGGDDTTWDPKTVISVVESFFSPHIRKDLAPEETDATLSLPSFSPIITKNHPLGNAVNIIPGIPVAWERITSFRRNTTSPGTWCKRYSNGYIEQGGIIRKEDYPDPGDVAISFLSSGGGTNSNYYDTGYSLTLTAHADGTLYPDNSSVNIVEKTISGFTCGRFFSSPTQHGKTDCSVSWIASGFTTEPE